MLVTVNREKTCLGHGKGWVELHALLHYRIPAIKSHFKYVHNTDYFCRCDVYQVVGFAKNQKKKDGALEKNVEFQFEFPRQYII